VTTLIAIHALVRTPVSHPLVQASASINQRAVAALDCQPGADPSLPLLTPAAALKALSAALAAAEIKRAAACFTSDARLITADRTTVSGRHQIAAVLAKLLDCQAELDFGEPAIVTASDIAFVTGTCSMRTKGPDVFWLTQRSEMTAVIRLIEGEWKLTILAPWGDSSGEDAQS
jgi:ketosteroid isomerase-like protein